MECHKSIAIFSRLYCPLIHVLNAIEISIDYEAAKKASDYKSRLCQFTFLANLKLLENALSVIYLKTADGKDISSYVGKIL